MTPEVDLVIEAYGTVTPPDTPPDEDGDDTDTEDDES